jgi:large repetitive protein
MNRSVGFTAVALLLLAFASPANATHVACGELLTTTTTLDGDITCGEGQQTGLFIGADNITLWMEGHSITSTSTTPGVGIQGDVSGVDIRGNGRISGFFYGVNLRGSDNNVRRLTIAAESGGTGITMSGNRSYAYRNVVDGRLAQFEAGIYLSGDDAYAWGNTVQEGGFAGAITTVGDNPRVVVNTVSCEERNADTYGVRTPLYTTSALVWGNTVTGCNRGIFDSNSNTDGSGAARLRFNEATGNNVGLYIFDNRAIAGRNTANNNFDTGIWSGAAGTRIQNNTANNNTNYGIFAADGTVDGGGNTATGNGTNCVNVACP